MYFSSDREEFYPLQILSLAFALILVAGMVFVLMFKKSPFEFSGTLFMPQQQSTVYILQSKENEAYLAKAHYNLTTYHSNLKAFKKEVENLGYLPSIIDIEDLENLSPRTALFVPDLYALSPKSMQKLFDFIKRGGNIFFNFHFLYFSPKGEFFGAKNIERITGLRYFKDVSKKKDDTLFIVPRLTSFLNASQQVPQRIDLVLYDPIPLFHAKNIPDAVLTNWQITMPPMVDETPLSAQDAGVLWHGRYGKGTWIYANFPLYSFLEMKQEDKQRYLGSILAFLTNKPIPVTDPFIHTKKAIFLSEDTEYKYPYLKNFAQLTHKYDIPATLFCVASLAQKYAKETKEVAALPNIEIGSHSFSHQKIIDTNESFVEKEIAFSKEVLEKISGKKVYGFRPPREEIDSLMEKWLKKAGYRYIMEKTKPQLAPFEQNGLVIIPRHGTDDYIYLVNLDWSKKEIVNQIIRETEFLSSINALYTLSVHTHLISYKNNISILEEYFQYLKKHPDIKAYSGKELAHIATLRKNISIKTQENLKSLILSIYNANRDPIQNFNFRLYSSHIEEIETVISEIITTNAKIIKRDKDESYIDIQVDKLYPQATLTLILPFK